jgi:adenylate cyclase
MALFGITAAQGAGNRDALRAARDMIGALDDLNREFGGTLAEPLRMGVGIHTGPAVLGRVGGSKRGSLTALGDSVNIASRLEGLNKQFGSVLVVSEDALIHSGLVFGEAEMREVPLRGRGVGLRVAVVHDVSTLRDRLPAET